MVGHSFCAIFLKCCHIE